VKNGSCNNDILLSTSTNAGASFTGGAQLIRAALAVVTTAAGQARSDQYWQAAAFSPNGFSPSATTIGSTARREHRYSDMHRVHQRRPDHVPPRPGDVEQHAAADPVQRHVHR